MGDRVTPTGGVPVGVAVGVTEEVLVRVGVKEAVGLRVRVAVGVDVAWGGTTPFGPPGEGNPKNRIAGPPSGRRPWE